jgi:hypothetical protein
MEVNTRDVKVTSAVREKARKMVAQSRQHKEIYRAQNLQPVAFPETVGRSKPAESQC